MASAAPPSASAGLTEGRLSFASCRLLVGGEGERGQQHVAGALLRLLEGADLHTISLPGLLMEGVGACKSSCDQFQ